MNRIQNHPPSKSFCQSSRSNHARHPPISQISLAPSTALPPQINPVNSLPSDNWTLPIPNGEGIPATKLPNSLLGTDQISASIALPWALSWTSAGRWMALRLWKYSAVVVFSIRFEPRSLSCQFRSSPSVCSAYDQFYVTLLACWADFSDRNGKFSCSHRVFKVLL